MRLFESTPSKVIIATTAASLAALGIVAVASKLSAPIPMCVTVQQRESPPPPPAPEPKPCRGCDLAAPA